LRRTPDTWRRLGARVCGGARYVSFYPTAFKNFVQRWLEGEPYGTCVSKSVTKAVRTPVQIYIPADAMARTKKWGGNVFQAATVLGKSKAARDYFTSCWLDEDEWQEGKSGKQNMNHSSHYLIAGNRKTTKNTVWWGAQHSGRRGSRRSMGDRDARATARSGG
jgi:hypothetical protein